MLTRVQEAPLSLDEVAGAVADPAAGAVCIFTGTVRDHSEAGSVTGLTYEAWHELAEERLAELAAEICERWSVCRVAIVHRVGELTVGEASVIVAVSARPPRRGVRGLPPRHRAAEAGRAHLEEGRPRLGRRPLGHGQLDGARPRDRPRHGEQPRLPPGRGRRLRRAGGRRRALRHGRGARAWARKPGSCSAATRATCSPCGPLRQGTMTEFDITQRMIEVVIKRAMTVRFPRPRVLGRGAVDELRGGAPRDRGRRQLGRCAAGDPGRGTARGGDRRGAARARAGGASRRRRRRRPIGDGRRLDGRRGERSFGRRSAGSTSTLQCSGTSATSTGWRSARRRPRRSRSRSGRPSRRRRARRRS